MMKICEDVEKAEVYKDFKNYVLSSDLSHEDVLKDMRAYAPFYKVILTNNSGNTKLDREIRIFKYLASWNKLDDEILDKLIQGQKNDAMKKIQGKNITEIKKLGKTKLFSIIHKHE